MVHWGWLSGGSGESCHMESEWWRNLLVVCLYFYGHINCSISVWLAFFTALCNIRNFSAHCSVYKKKQFKSNYSGSHEYFRLILSFFLKKKKKQFISKFVLTQNSTLLGIGTTNPTHCDNLPAHAAHCYSQIFWLWWLITTQCNKILYIKEAMPTLSQAAFVGCSVHDQWTKKWQPAPVSPIRISSRNVVFNQ